LVVCRLDRLGRSLADLLVTVGQLEARGVGFRSLTESIGMTDSLVAGIAPWAWHHFPNAESSPL
jgi:DNA invertase Pin-like site-specific DNA recombinase